MDHFLKERYRKRSREALKRAIESGSITVERDLATGLVVGRLKPSTQLIPGDSVLVLSERKPEPPVNFNYKVLHEDDDLFVIEKPANLPVHPAGRYFFNTLLVHLKTEGHKNPMKAEREFFLVHRIDKETSGILVLAKERTVAADLVKQFADRKTEKTYLAIARGKTPDEFEVDAPMNRDPHSAIGLKMAILPEDSGGLSAKTRFKRLEMIECAPSTPGAEPNYLSIVECYPKTGRQHQIRLHLEHAGHPILGDKLYGLPEKEALKFYDRARLTPEDEARLLHPRHALHSAGIRFTNPTTKRPMEFKSGLPEDLMEFIRDAKAGRVDFRFAHPLKAQSPH
ncbi:MAG: RluA family pseudouridine synthase [Bdellovibrionales bacterium]|nr:RluA family pseudouridine synthase [Bdellovibrionales bacterium]